MIKPAYRRSGGEGRNLGLEARRKRRSGNKDWSKRMLKNQGERGVREQTRAS